MVKWENNKGRGWCGGRGLLHFIPGKLNRFLCALVRELATDCHNEGSSRFSREVPQAGLIFQKQQQGVGKAEVVLQDIPDFFLL